jgi:hypothetical protein
VRVRVRDPDRVRVAVRVRVRVRVIVRDELTVPDDVGEPDTDGVVVSEADAELVRVRWTVQRCAPFARHLRREVELLGKQLRARGQLEAAAERAFKETAGAIVVMEVHTGRLLVVTSTPSFDPNLVSGYFDPREKARLDAMNDLRPWRFRAIQDQYAPGSTFKPITLLAALRRHEVGPHDHATCVGAFLLGTTRFRCWNDRGHGSVDGPWALAKSCDVYFYQLGNRMGLDPIASEAFDLGFGRKTGIAIDGESDGIMPTEADINQLNMMQQKQQIEEGCLQPGTQFQDRNDMMSSANLQAAAGFFTGAPQ